MLDISSMNEGYWLKYVSEISPDTLQPKAYGRLECARLAEWTIHDAPNATASRLAHHRTHILADNPEPRNE